MAGKYAGDVVRLGRRDEEEKREEEECRFELRHCRFRGERTRREKQRSLIFEFFWLWSLKGSGGVKSERKSGVVVDGDKAWIWKILRTMPLCW